MATQERKHIETYKDIAGYHFERYAEWQFPGNGCDNNLLKALGNGPGPRELLKKVLAAYREEPYTSNGWSNFPNILQDFNMTLNSKQIGNPERLPRGYLEADGYYVRERLKSRRPRHHEDGLIIYFESKLYNGQHEYVVTGVCELLYKVYKTKTVFVTPASYPQGRPGTPVPLISSIETIYHASTSFDKEGADAERASLMSQRSMLNQQLNWTDRRIQILEEALSLPAQAAQTMLPAMRWKDLSLTGM